MKHRLIGLGLLLAMCFQLIVFAMPCCVDMQPLRLDMPVQAGVSSPADHGDPSYIQGQISAFGLEDSAVQSEGSQMHQCPLMAVVPAFSLATLSSEHAALPGVGLASAVLNPAPEFWMATRYLSLLERPPKA